MRRQRNLTNASAFALALGVLAIGPLMSGWGGNAALAGEPDANLIAAIASARNWFDVLQSGSAASVLELAARHKVDRSHISRTLPLAFLAPDIVKAIIDGRNDPGLTLSRIKCLKLPASWRVQRELLGVR